MMPVASITRHPEDTWVSYRTLVSQRMTEGAFERRQSSPNLGFRTESSLPLCLLRSCITMTKRPLLMVDFRPSPLYYSP